MSSRVDSMAVYDDGSGPQVYVGGGFGSAGRWVTDGVSRYDGERWSVVPVPWTGTVTDMTVHDGGSGPRLWVAVSGFQEPVGVAAWDGASWETWSINSGPVSGGAAVLSFQGQLYLGGTFITIDGQPAVNLARYDGTGGWSQVGGSGSPRSVTELEASSAQGQERPYVGTRDAGGAAEYTLSYFDGSDLVPVPGIQVEIQALASRTTPEGERLLVGSVSEQLLSLGAGGLNPFSDGSPAGVQALATRTENGVDVVYAGGTFALAGGKVVNGIARWDGFDWQPLAGTGQPAGVEGAVTTLLWTDVGVPSGEQLFVGGAFEGAGGEPAASIARWQDASWSAVSEGQALEDTTRTGAVFDDGNGPLLYTGSTLWPDGGEGGIVRWTGDRWEEAPGNPVPPGTEIWAMTVWDDGGGPALYAGGEDVLWRFDGATWTDLGPISGTVFALEGWDDGSGPALYAGGYIQNVAGTPVTNVARWNGAAWSSIGDVGTGLEGVFALEVFAGDSTEELYAGGSFTVAGGVPAAYVASWDGTSWAPLLEGTDAFVGTLLAVDLPSVGGEQLLVGGAFRKVGSQTQAQGSKGIARWSGSSWGQKFPGALQPFPAPGRAESFCVWNDGDGPALVVAGRLFVVNGENPNVIRLQDDGNGWDPIAKLTLNVDVLVAVDASPRSEPSLWALGSFVRVDDALYSPYAARYFRPRVPVEFASWGTASSELSLAGALDPTTGEVQLTLAGAPAGTFGMLFLGEGRARIPAAPFTRVAGIASRVPFVSTAPAGAIPVPLLDAPLPPGFAGPPLFAQAVAIDPLSGETGRSAVLELVPVGE